MARTSKIDTHQDEFTAASLAQELVSAPYRDLPIGTAVYYTGGVANQLRLGEIVAIRNNDVGMSYDIKLAEKVYQFSGNLPARMMNGISPNNFSGSVRRFQLVAEFSAQ